MNPFLCVVDLRGAPLGADALASAVPGLAGGRGRIGAVLHGAWGGAWVPSAALGRPAVAHRHEIVAVGDVRLTNRKGLLADSSGSTDGWTDLDLVIDRYVHHGERGIRDLIGDFAFVLWDIRRQVLCAARDGLGVKSLYYRRRGDRLTLASHVECLDQGPYDQEFLGHFLIGLPSATTRTVFRDVTRLAAGSLLVVQDARLRTETYWSPAEFAPALDPIDEREASAEFRRLFTEAVSAQLGDGLDTWAQLSGGLDSSSNVCLAAELADRGAVRRLSGTISVVDSLGQGDETRYSNAVLERHPFRNEQVVDYWAWQDDAIGVPNLGQPHAFLPFFARDREVCRIVREAGGNVVLSGFGSDHYLAGPPIYIADYLAGRRIRQAVDLTVDLAVSTRQSFWKLGYRHGIHPLLPRGLQVRWADRDAVVPQWVRPEFARQHELAARMLRLEVATTGAGRFADQVAAEVGAIDLAFEPETCRDGIEIRYPFLYRPLVEFSLALAPTLRARPGNSKWVLREALRGTLPEGVRTRPSKGGIDARVFWSLNQERAALQRLIAGSHLAELGLVDRGRLARVFERAAAGDTSSVGLLWVTLSLETWLAVRSGRWSSSRCRSNPNRLPSTAGSRTYKESGYEAAIH